MHNIDSQSLFFHNHLADVVTPSCSTCTCLRWCKNCGVQTTTMGTDEGYAETTRVFRFREVAQPEDSKLVMFQASDNNTKYVIALVFENCPRHPQLRRPLGSSKERYRWSSLSVMVVYAPKDSFSDGWVPAAGHRHQVHRCTRIRKLS